MLWRRDSAWSHLVADGPEDKMSGKYLFFSTDRSELIKIAEDEVANHGFFRAKISLSAAGGEFVLCLYWINDSRKHELGKRHGINKKVKYRWWKSDAASRRGEYSDQYKASLDRKPQSECCGEEDEDEDRPY